MTSTKKKGQSKELLCSKELQSQGYFIAFRAFTVKRGPMYVGVDFGDVFDVVGIKQMTGSETPDWKFVSCSYVSHRAEKITAVKEFKNKYNILDMSFEVWLWSPSRWRGRGVNKHWESATWEKIIV